jgi:hypothetical protein
VIDPLIIPKKSNQYANRFITAIRYKQMDDNAVFIPVMPAFFLLAITTDIEKLFTNLTPLF